MNILADKTKYVKWYTFFFPIFFDLIVWVPTYCVLKFFLRLKIVGKENLNLVSPPFILTCNHTSELDPIIVKAIFGIIPPLFPTFYIAREKEFYKKRGVASMFYGGLFFKLWGAYPAKVGLRNYERALSQHIEILNTGRRCAVCVFPEGKITKDGTPQAAKGGLSYLAKRTQIPIIPVAINGIWQMSVYDFFRKQKRAKIIIGKPISYKEIFENRYYTPEEHKLIAQNILDRIIKLNSAQ